MRRPLVVVMGVSGSGKSTVGEALAGRLGLDYADADDFHSAANVATMAAGRALTDADRAPWLAATADWLAAHADTGGVVACSALRRSYRDVLRSGASTIAFVHLDAERDKLLERLRARTGHFMPASLLDSQLEALEPPGPDERALVLDAGAPADRIVDLAVAALTRGSASDLET